MLQRSGHSSLQLMGQSGEAFVCTRLPRILQCVRQDNARKDGGLWLCKAQIMLYVSLGWSSVFIVDLNVSSVWASAEALLHQSHLASLGRTSAIVSPLKMIMDWLACVTTIKLYSVLQCSDSHPHPITLIPPPTLFSPAGMKLVSLSLPLFLFCISSSERICTDSQLGS